MRIDTYRAFLKIDLRYCCFRERDQHGALALEAQFNQIATAKIENGTDNAIRLAVSIKCFKANQISLKKLILIKIIIRQLRTIDKKLGSVQRFGSIAIINTFKAYNHHSLGRTCLKHLIGFALCIIDLAIVGNRQRVVGICLDPDFAAYAMGGSNNGKLNRVLWARHENFRN